MQKPLEELVHEFVYVDSQEQNLRPNSISDRRETLKRLLNYLKDQPLCLETAKAYYASLQNRWRPSGIRHEIKVLRAFLNWCVENEYIVSNFAKRIKIPKVHYTPEPLVSAEIAEKCILEGFTLTENDSCLHRERKELMMLAMRFALRTGLRGEELTTLKSSGFVYNGIDSTFLVHSKGGNTDIMPLPIDMIEEIRRQATQEFLFPQLNMKRCNLALKKGGEVVGIPKNVIMHVHLLRKIFGTTLARSLRISKVAKLMRHSDLSITQKFYISYGLNELSEDLAFAHPLIRLTMPPEQVLQNFFNNEVTNFFKHDSRFKPSFEINNGELVIRVQNLTSQPQL